MEAIILVKSTYTPSVILDKTQGKFELEGRSLAEDAVSFYTPILEWIKEYSESPNENTIFEFKINYYNTASSKFILDIILALENITSNGGNVIVHWYYEEEDEEMLEAGQEFQAFTDITFEFPCIT